MVKNNLGINIDDLKRFSEKANIIADNKYKDVYKQSVTINIENGFGKVSTNFPDEFLLSSFLMKLRFFIIENDNKFNFENVCNFFIQNNFEKEETLKWLKFYLEIFDNEIFKIKVGEKDLTMKMVFNTILNEDNFHSEKEQKGMKFIKSHPIIEQLSRSKFLTVLSELKIIISSFNKLVVEKYLKQYEK